MRTIDRAFADLVRRADKPAIVVANKSESRAGQVGALESYALGLGDPVPISAEHGEGMADLYDALRAVKLLQAKKVLLPTPFLAPPTRPECRR